MIWWPWALVAFGLGILAGAGLMTLIERRAVAAEMAREDDPED